MCKRFLPIVIPLFCVVLIALGLQRYFAGPAVNPDPNHTHADFAVWIGGTKLDFAQDQYMSGLSTDANHDTEEGNRKYLHLHDGIGHVVHRHKPGLTLGDFFATIGYSFASVKVGESCWFTLADDRPFSGCESGPMKLYVNGTLREGDPEDYVFADEDELLITDAADPAVVETQRAALTDDACKYSKTCPWKGAPPAENCIADPAVPCVMN